MQAEIETITVNGKTYYASKPNEAAESFDGMKYVIVRAASAGVFAGYLASREGTEAVVKRARRLWYWSGAASLSQLAMEGTKKPNDCKFPCEVSEILVTGVIEILDVTAKAKASIESVKVWAQ